VRATKEEGVNPTQGSGGGGRFFRFSFPRPGSVASFPVAATFPELTLPFSNCICFAKFPLIFTVILP